jgi:hypothetical protein
MIATYTQVRTEELCCLLVRAEGLLAGQSLELISPRVKVDSNTSTAALRVAGGDERGIQCLGV